MRLDLNSRAEEIASFLGLDRGWVRSELEKGFGYFHAKVAEDFRRENPRTDEELLGWYRSTEAYIWELSAYHADPGFNYDGMCEGIARHLEHEGKRRVLGLGDGIGDLTLTLLDAGFIAIYHDLCGSKTSAFAMSRFCRRSQAPATCFTSDWTPDFGGLECDAVIALDVMEHLPNVAEWVEAIYTILRPGGTALFQNAFGIGDDEHEGSIPQHLVRNNIYIDEWPRLMRSVGFIEGDGGWWSR